MIAQIFGDFRVFRNHLKEIVDLETILVLIIERVGGIQGRWFEEIEKKSPWV